MIFNVNVQPNSEEDHEFNLALEDRVLLQIRSMSVVPGNFSASLIFPDGSKVDLGERSSIDYDFICKTDGKYCLKLIKCSRKSRQKL